MAVMLVLGHGRVTRESGKFNLLIKVRKEISIVRLSLGSHYLVSFGFYCVQACMKQTLSQLQLYL